MKKVMLLFAIMLPSLLMAQDSTNHLTLYEGTIVSLELLEDLNSKTANVGDIISFQTNEHIIAGDKVIVPKGAVASGKVTEAAQRKMGGKAGMLNFTIDYLTLPGGRVVKLTSEQKGKGKNKTGAAVAQAVLLTPLFLLKKGKDIKFDKGQVFKAFIENDVQL